MYLAVFSVSMTNQDDKFFGTCYVSRVVMVHTFESALAMASFAVSQKRFDLDF